MRRARLVMWSYRSPSRQERLTTSPPGRRPLRLKGGLSGADLNAVSVSATAGPPLAVQMALLAKVLDSARPTPASSPIEAASQAASSQALLESVTALDVLA